ncbi:hypothetical protein BR93DRAFT_536763 [Coniochaeta sp. PMI_546]|nr:hypothetical protein BR93DRAFT_536763 [Coniochaeta sp. PMI_546]
MQCKKLLEILVSSIWTGHGLLSSASKPEVLCGGMCVKSRICTQNSSPFITASGGTVGWLQAAAVLSQVASNASLSL